MQLIASRSVASFAALIVCGVIAAVQPAQATAFPKLFGTTEVRSTNLKPFVKWTGMLGRYFKQAHLRDGDCSESAFSQCHLQEWQSFLDRAQQLSPMEQLVAVNDFMNRAPYITDIRNWGVDDYWATPMQFFDRDGDCEDYAIAKYMSLRALGFPVEQLRVAVVQDLNLAVPHAVLVVYLNDDGFVLDNQVEQVISQRKIHHYRPYYTVNESAWWLHKS